MSTLLPASCVVVLVHYRDISHTIACLQSIELLESEPCGIVVVKNSRDDDDGFVTSLRESTSSFRYGEITIFVDGFVTAPSRFVVVLNKDNKGFSGGCNAGIKAAFEMECCRAVWFLNNDTIVSSNSLGELCSELNNKTAVGLCGSTLYYYDKEKSMQCAGGCHLSLWTGATKFVSIADEFLNGSDIKAVVLKKLDYLCGASFLVRREVLETVGIFDTRYFLYYEDADLCLRARRAGYALGWASHSVVWHHEGGASGARGARSGLPPDRSRLVDYLCLRNRVWIMRQYYPFFLPVVCLSFLAVLLRRMWRGQIDRLGLVGRAFADGLTGRMGNPDPARYAPRRR